jgi:quinol monooxygenase YgiN
MIFIVVKWTVKPERSGNWLADVEEFTQGTRSEPGNIFFEWSRSVDNPNQFVLVEGFQDDAAAASGAQATNFLKWSEFTWAAAETPQIINTTIPGTGWSRMAEVTPR